MNDLEENAPKFKEEDTIKWLCGNCGKENQGGRIQCWNCESMKDGSVTKPASRIAHEAQTITGSTGSLQKPAADSTEIRALMSRYWDAYVVARATVGLGEIIKLVAAGLAALIIISTLLIAGKIGGGVGLAAILLGVIGAAFVGGQFYLFGLIVMAQGQILKASLDGAVNSSPFLQNEHRAKIMSLK